MKDSKTGSSLTAISVGTGAVWFSTHCGAGFASGTQELQYFANHGWYGPIMPLITFAIIAITYYFGVETARQVGKYSYAEWSKEAFGPLSPVCSICLEISVIVTTVSASAAAIAAGAELINQQLGVPQSIGLVLMFAIITLLCIFGEKVVRNNAMIMTVAILIIITIVIILGLVKFAPNIRELFSTHYTNPAAPKWSVTGTKQTIKGNFGNALLWALTYSGFQIGAVGAVTAAFRGAHFKKESKSAIGIGYFLNVVMLCGVCLLIFSNMPEIYTNSQARLLPTVYIVQHLNFKPLAVLYPILLFLALITTAVGLVFGMVLRLDPYVLKNMKQPVLKKAIISLGILLICFIISKQGLMFVIQVAYKYLGVFSWIGVIIPMWIFAPKAIKARDKLAQAKEVDAEANK